jgi:hypothetical protein
MITGFTEFTTIFTCTVKDPKFFHNHLNVHAPISVFEALGWVTWNDAPEQDKPDSLPKPGRKIHHFKRDWPNRFLSPGQDVEAIDTHG